MLGMVLAGWCLCVQSDLLTIKPAWLSVLALSDIALPHEHVVGFHVHASMWATQA